MSSSLIISHSTELVLSKGMEDLKQEKDFYKHTLAANKKQGLPPRISPLITFSKIGMLLSATLVRNDLLNHNQ